MSSGLSPVVEAVVDEKVQNDEMFTAHDITLEVRKRGHKAGHTEVRDAVHDYYSRGGMGLAYGRTNISVPGGQPFLYHRQADDPNTYGNVRGGGGSSSASPASIQIPSSQTTDDNDDDDGTQVNIPGINIPANLISNLGHSNGSSKKNSPGVVSGRSVDGRETLSIPAPLVRKFFKPGAKVYAVAENAAGQNSVQIVNHKPVVTTLFASYTVDAHNQVRLTQNFLNRAGIGGKSYDIEDAGNNIKVKLHS